MARKADDLLADLDNLGVDEQPPPRSTTPSVPSSKPGPVSSDDDLFGDLQAQLAARPSQQTSRPGTPRVASSTTSAATRPGYTPASSGPPSGRTSSEDRARRSMASIGGERRSGEGREFHRAVTPGQDEEPLQQEKAAAPVAQTSGGGGWWGSLTSAASAAVKQAETLAKEISGNEEAQRWADQVRSIGGKNLSNLQYLGSDITSRALPTFTSLIQHIAPPISAHERLQIHATHDVVGYPSLDPLIYGVFSRTMAQVEGGELMVIQRGSEQRSRGRTGSEAQGYRGGVLGTNSSGWSDGPWWRDEGLQRSLGAVEGLVEGTRLARVSAEAYAKEFFERSGGVEAAAKRASEVLSESNPVRSSDIFLAIQAIGYEEDKALFADSARREDEKSAVAEPPADAEPLIAFAIYLHDPLHSLSFSALSQPFPRRWADWLDASASDENGLPDSIQEIIAAGGVDPREWVAEWVEEVLSLGVGLVAQRYVAKRMGVGEGGLGRGKRREESDMIGEAARAI
nr:hypothetical protein B0A51_07861 [Rachicladosporium sp. CCFEE 5018]